MPRNAPRSTRDAAAPAPSGTDRSDSRLMRVPAETYEVIQRWSKLHRRHMKQEIAVIVEEWDQLQQAKEAKTKKAV